MGILAESRCRITTLSLARNHDILPHVRKLHLRHCLYAQYPMRARGSAGASIPHIQSFIHAVPELQQHLQSANPKVGREWETTCHPRTALVMLVLMSANESIVYFPSRDGLPWSSNWRGQRLRRSRISIPQQNIPTSQQHHFS